MQSIRYANGVVENIVVSEPVYKSDPYSKSGNGQNTFKAPKRVHPKVIWALLAVIFFGWLFGLGAIVGLVFLYYAMKEIDMNPDKYKGRKLAKIVNWICWAFITYWVFGLIALLLYYL
ncbi:MAG: hypothetical protein IPI93_05470 [Sphingobacteriaceae bacterium]|nr:hypothetical protein [Sphingobacteriaceae bacterium]